MINSILQFLYQLFMIVVLVFFVQSFLFQPFKIPSSSMKPGLQISDYLIVKKLAYGYNNSSLSLKSNIRNFFNQNFFQSFPQRGDIVVFTLPNDSKSFYIKRIIGMPEEILQIKNDILYINKNPISKKTINKDYFFNSINSICEESLPNKRKYFINYNSYSQNYIGSFYASNTSIYSIPSGHFFLLGDNRNNSTDSRMLNSVGYVSSQNIIGRAIFLFWATDLTLVKTLNGLNISRVFRDIV